ncbi:MAG: excinuclease ABC subunit UvrC [Candidatus Latescibacteria bacterium]|nr:excinuclease ABC subunit UvrC [Candidatus Latescibacterota bacterium]MBT4136921.1 excinuclease ABC subunit UvrC [Candidatus Latescibacterota bacterium]
MDAVSQNQNAERVDRKAIRAHIDGIVAHLPKEPGVYIMKGDGGKIVYIGKAKSLRSRVQQYFRPKAHDGRRQFRALVRSVCDLEYIVTDTELEALILEANLIKAHKPRYNIRLKDDKKYPFLKITKEAFPRVLVTRDVVKDGSRYLGPYTDVKAMRRMLETMHRLFRIRSCDYALPTKNVRVCLDYEIKRCDGPCEALIVSEDYQKIVDEAILFLTGRHTQVMLTLKLRMQQAAEALRFEEAVIFRDRIQALEQATSRQRVVSHDLTDWDTISIAREDDEACGVVMEVRDGRLIGRQNYFIGGVLDATEEEVVTAFVKLFYATAAFVPKEICLPCDIEERETMLDWLRDRSDGLVEIRIPQRGDKFRLMKMAENNAKLLLTERRLKRENRKQQAPAAVQALQRDLNLDKPPRHIEAMDISNIQGTDPVASMVCFIDGRPRKSEYRHFKITGIEGPNDFAMMQQVVTRRFKRLMEEGKAFPDLLLVDGGKGQLSSSVKALEELGIKDQPIIGLAKRLEEVFRPGLSDPQNIPKTSASLRLLQGLRDESHRFAITYHRKLRQKRTLTSELDDIPGIGPNRRKTLLRHFGSLKKVREASAVDIATVDGISKKLAGEIYGALQEKEKVVSG